VFCSGAPENRQRVVETDVVRPLLDLMAGPKSGMVDKAAYVLNSLGISGEGRAAVEESASPGCSPSSHTSDVFACPGDGSCRR
jgi:hypothetical protein